MRIIAAIHQNTLTIAAVPAILLLSVLCFSGVAFAAAGGQL